MGMTHSASRRVVLLVKRSISPVRPSSTLKVLATTWSGAQMRVSTGTPPSSPALIVCSHTPGAYLLPSISVQFS
ncbi:hypothetical protein D1793_17905 [Halomonas sp. JS92-SW72]|nr:hypothetical protein D1793_17905 [Halomonas sp. JS92-SW72]